MLDMTVTIRQMKVEDLQDVKRVDMVAWEELIRRDYPDVVKFTSRTDQNILSFLHSEAKGAFVACDDRAGVIGSSFCHVWGKTGWVGPISVLPSYQGRGVGKELLKSSLRYLEDRACFDIGLETMPENQVNLGMYLKVGMRPEGLVLVMGRKLDEAEPPEESFGEVTVDRYSESDVKGHLLAQVKRISNALSPGLDYSSEVVLTQEYSFGDTLVASHRGKVSGFCVLHTVPRREQMEVASIRVLATDPSVQEDIVGPLVTAAEIAAIDARSVEISLPIPGQCRRPMDIAFSRDCQLVQTYARLMWMGGSGVSEKTNNLCTWSG